MIGMLATLVGTILLSIISSPRGKDIVENMVENDYISPAREIDEILSEQGSVEDVDALNDIMEYPVEGDQDLQKIEKIEDTMGQARFHFTNTTETGHVANLSKSIDNRKEQLVKQNQVVGVRYSLELVVLGFVLQFASMIARHVVVIS
ncbi:hypothetical protein [Halomicrobium salinisoli]|uniref:hypothetical protein n=1 Tax=Halomicrobium salinisoli TaxID=2878391 RepID=UPI001CEFD3BF|nr:hypothetical protein [Halomicrobium salinisoli]